MDERWGKKTGRSQWNKGKIFISEIMPAQLVTTNQKIKTRDAGISQNKKQKNKTTLLLKNRQIFLKFFF